MAAPGGLTPTAFDALIYSVACKSALRAGDRNKPEELSEIIKMLEENPDVTHCAHGRPVAIRISKGKIEKMFGR
jgi:DNA mismatch repair protein MutL